MVQPTCRGQDSNRAVCALPHHSTSAVERKAKAMNTNANEKENVTPEIELTVEEIEEMIAPGFRFNHNETVEVDLTVEEVEEVIAPGIRWNHNETLLRG
jgi:hypothetical protein